MARVPTPPLADDASADGWTVAVRVAAPILLVAIAVAALWVEAPSAGDPGELKGVRPAPSASPPARPPREVTYEPWELVRT